MHQSIRKVEITLPENPDQTWPVPRVLKLEVQTADPLGVLEVLERFLSGKPIILPGHLAAPTKDPLIDATRPAGTPRSEEQRALEDEAEAIGGVVTHAAGGVPVVVPAGEEPIGIPVEPATPGVTGAVTYAGVDQGVAGAQPDTEGKAIVEAVRERLFTPPAAEPTGVPEVHTGDKVAFQTHDGITYVLHDGKPLPADLQRLVAGAEGRLVVQKVSKRKDCLIALVEGGWAVKLVADAAGLPAVLEVKPPAVPTQPPRRVDTPVAAPAPTPVSPPVVPPTVADPGLAAEVEKAMAILPKLQAADGVRGVMEELIAAGVPREQIFAVCTAIREHVPCVKKQPNLKDRIPRLLMIIGQS